MEALLRLLTGRPGVVVLATLAVTLFFATRIVNPITGAPGLVIDPSTRTLLPRGDASDDFRIRIERLFAARDALVVGLRSEDVFRAEALRTVQAVTRALERVEGVTHVVSLSNALDVRGADGEIFVEPFFDAVPDEPEALERLRKAVLENPLYRGSLVARDSRASAFVVHLADLSENEFVERAVDLQVLETARAAAGGGDVWLTGPPHVKAETSRLIFQSLARILPICMLIMAAIGLLAFRTFRGVWVPLASVGIALVWTLGLVAWVGPPLNLVTTIVPPLMLTIGFAYTVHVVAEHAEVLHSNPEELQKAGGPAAVALRHVALPVVLTALTTAAGFLSLTISPFRAVREFGWISVVGIVFTAFVSLVFTPAALEVLRRPRREPPPRAAWVNAWFERLGHIVVRRRRPIVTVGIALGIGSLLAATRMEVNSDLISNFRPEHPVRQHFIAINEHLDGAMPFDVVLETERRNGIIDPESLRHIEALQAWLTAQPDVGGTTSIVDHVKLLHQAAFDGDPGHRSIPANARLTNQLLFLDGDETNRYVDRERRTARIEVRARTPDSRDLADLVARVRARLDELPGDLVAQVTGTTVLLAGSMDAIAASQIQTLSLAFVFIYAILALLFTSLRVGLVALLPNALPVAFYFGVLGTVGISLNTTTGLFACIVLGIAVDDTIHLLTRFNVEARKHADETLGAVQALRGVGRPVTVTTVALCLGFLALTTSDLRGQVEFGALGALTLAFAWLVDVTFTPALCSQMRIVTLWDALTFDLGAEPQRSIPLLRGLSNAQARIAALMTDVMTYPAGAPIFRAGDPGRDILVLIDGEMRVSIQRGGKLIEFDRAARGDVIGEVGLFRGARTADVDALSDVRVLRLTPESLDRLCKRYPRIGARVYRNLSEILADRLARATRRI